MRIQLTLIILKIYSVAISFIGNIYRGGKSRENEKGSVFHFLSANYKKVKMGSIDMNEVTVGIIKM